MSDQLCVQPIEQDITVPVIFLPVAVPPATVDRVTMTSPTGVPLIKDTLMVTLPASSRTE